MRVRHLAADSAGPDVPNGVVSFWQADLNVYVYQLNEEGASMETAMGAAGAGGGDGGADGADGDGVLSNYTQWDLPAREFEGLWER